MGAGGTGAGGTSRGARPRPDKGLDARRRDRARRQIELAPPSTDLDILVEPERACRDVALRLAIGQLRVPTDDRKFVRFAQAPDCPVHSPPLEIGS